MTATRIELGDLIILSWAEESYGRAMVSTSLGDIANWVWDRASLCAVLKAHNFMQPATGAGCIAEILRLWQAKALTQEEMATIGLRESFAVAASQALHDIRFDVGGAVPDPTDQTDLKPGVVTPVSPEVSPPGSQKVPPTSTTRWW